MQRALVTGTSSGIGEATALRLARDGNHVIATMRDPRRSTTLDEAAAAEGLSIEVIALDVDDDASVSAAFAEAGDIDVLVNNAGYSPVAAVEDMPIDQWKALFETNVFGVVRCIQAALPGMRERHRGHIVNISSVAGRTATPIFGPYSASKWAVEALSESLACEAAIFGIRTTIVEPGAVATPIREKTGVPDRSSPYRPVAKNWGFWAGYDHAHARGPEEVADAIAEAVAADDPPLRVTVGSGVDEAIALRAQHTDEEWVRLWSSDTADFLDSMRDLQGVDLTQSARR